MSIADDFPVLKKNKTFSRGVLLTPVRFVLFQLIEYFASLVYVNSCTEYGLEVDQDYLVLKLGTRSL